MSNLWQTLFYQPILWALIFLYKMLGQSLGLAIIFLTFLIRGLLVPVTLPATRSAQKMAQIKPQLDALKKKHGKNPKQLQKEQLKLYQQHKLNPAAGCLPQIVQLLFLIALFQVLNGFITNGGSAGLEIKTRFLWLDLAKPDPLYILPILAGLSQMAFSFLMKKQTAVLGPADKKKESKKDEEGMAEIMQKQMMFMMPLMTVVIALRFPSGLALYWVVTTLFSLGQQYYLAKPGAV